MVKELLLLSHNMIGIIDKMPAATGDYWIIIRDNGEPVYIQQYEAIQRYVYTSVGVT